MPVMDLTFPQGAFSEEARQSVVDELTTILLRAEGAPDTEFFRTVTWVFLHELPGTHVLAAGRPVTEPVFKLEVTTPQGALSDRRRKMLVAEATEAIRRAAGLSDQETLRIWVLCREIAEGSWGAGGNVVEFEKLRAAARAERETPGTAEIPTASPEPTVA